MTNLRLVVLGIAAAALVAGCGSTPKVAQADLEKQASTLLEQKTGQRPDDISCPGDLTGKVGTKMTCTLTAGSDKLNLDISVTSVDGSDVKFNAQVITPPVKQAVLEQQVSNALEKQVGKKPDKIACPGDLESKIGATTTCTLTAGSDKLDVHVKVSSVKGSHVGFDIKVDTKTK